MKRTAMRLVALGAAVLIAGGIVVGASAGSGRIGVSRVVDVSNDQLSQNETPLAVNPANPQNLITGANDWNFNDGCAVNATFDGARPGRRRCPTASSRA